jgi:hypothetical protein
MIVARFGVAHLSFDIFSCYAPMIGRLGGGGGLYSSLQSGSVPRNRKLAMLKLVRRIIAGVWPNFTSYL